MSVSPSGFKKAYVRMLGTPVSLSKNGVPYTFARVEDGEYEGEDTFLFAPETGDFDLRDLAYGTLVACHPPKPAGKEGRAKCKTNALPLIDQDFYQDSQESKQLSIPDPAPEQEGKKKSSRTTSISLAYTKARYDHIDKCIQAHSEDFQGRTARSKALGHCIDLCIKNNLY